MDSIVEQLRSAYDAVPYISSTFPQTSPDNLRTVAALAGISSTPATTCRVLEIGCATGANIAPMAQVLPGSRFLGIDLSPRQIADGNELIQKAGLSNIELRCQDLLDFSEEGPFDYIIAHGVYSWVPQNVREKLLDVCAKNLSPNGIAYISYNTLPGWHTKRIFRDMMQFHGRRESTPDARLAKARQMLALASQVQSPPASFQQALKETIERTSKEGDWFLLHDDLGLINDPVYLEQFAAHAAAHGLRHIGGARPNIDLFHALPSHVQEQINQSATTAIEREQYGDFLCGRVFRESLLCRADVVASGPRDTDAVRNMYIASNAVEETVTDSAGAARVRFGKPKSSVKFRLPGVGIIAAIRLLIKSWPSTVSFANLLEAAVSASPPDLNLESLAQTLAQGFLTAYRADIVELWSRPTDFIDATIGEYPLAPPWARLQASRSESVINLRYSALTISGSIFHLLPLLDGTRNHADLCRELAGMVDRNELTLTSPQGTMLTASDDLSPVLDHLLQQFRLNSLLWTRPSA